MNGWSASFAPIRQQPVDANGINDGAEQDMSADFRPLLQQFLSARFRDLPSRRDELRPFDFGKD
ncbi:hypothetical protein ATY79_23140 [Rhizobium sp. R693]|nr:hypothetical protein ATY79_23140 [Rhizobium sp. R693]